ncbi:methylated-DNA-[protein]-cysteine S-methyltransferase [Oikeobacillus pervagus]|uniref:Methylated-DNA--protein-cysteine methyltransferase n=1 Tax=Oikeobacillus pervagus TaxID=1325931 RepID=A0AAJ1WGB0_9BACI|nr:methylated-DNA--[protein]-cysteine S-methyltransferase [Oikeobacillus pervagus]MDQ0214847.1 methylated-DNA-[protein]-cysteine S-methyltransferase [Oikeobacillus pervagus]
MTQYFLTFHCILGPLSIVANDSSITSIEFEVIEEKEDCLFQPDHPILQQAERELLEYFQGERKLFSVPIFYEGTVFQRAVWEALLQIPYGETCSYQDIAEKIGKPKAVRAVGQANKANAIPIIIPCHRVIGKNKKLTGYAGKQIDKKESLLKIEKAFEEIKL